MSHLTLWLMGQEISFPIADLSPFEPALEHLFDESPSPLVVEGTFILRRTQDSISLHMIFKHFPQFIESRIQCALDFIHTHYQNDISFEQIAHSACLSPCYFCRLFRREMGISCSQYLNLFRITQAKQRLGSTDLSISQICFEVGFNSLTHFERVFKQNEGGTPSKYRKAITAKKAKNVEKKATDVEPFSLP